MPALTPNTRLGPYEILDAIGAGGMGEVYKARDTRLDRVVAIKVLASSLASDVQSRERFEREAKAISSLNHPNICALYDVGRERPTADEPPVDFLVMEYVEGETLTARMARGPSRASRNALLSRGDAASEPAATPQVSPSNGPPPMTVEEALAVAIQIAGALDRAHRQGIVHRDLKPGNVMLSKGTVKLLDFGLARLSRPGAASAASDGLGHGLVSLADLSMPTVSSPLTMKGTILGTLQYMSPEQLEGKDVDARTDIFAFGGVLYEMLTGRRPFEGKSQASLIGAILDHTPPPVTSLQPVSPPMLDEIVARCLAKDPDDRWQSVRDLKRQLEWVSTRLTDGSALNAAGATKPAIARRSPRRAAASVGAALVLGGALAGVAAWMRWPHHPPSPKVARFAIDLPEGQAFTRTGRHVLALSPDGTRAVYVANQQLYLRTFNELIASPISGTEKSNPAEPVFSPDGQWVAFWSDGELRKVPVGGGTPVILAPAENPWGASWQGDRILLGQSAPRGIVEIPSNGGPPQLLVSLDDKKNELGQSPQLVSSGRAVVFALRTGAGAWDDAAIVVQELATGRRTVLVNGGTDPHVLPTGHLVYVREATLFAIGFDETRLAVTSGSVPIQRGIQQAPTTASGVAQWAWSASGSALFIPGIGNLAERFLVWIDRNGHEERAPGPSRAFSPVFSGLRLSPDGTRAALTIDATGSASSAGGATAGAVSSSDIWIWEIARGTMVRLTFSNAATSAVWTPDGRRVCYRNVAEIVCQSADGSGQPQRLGTVDGLLSIKSFSPDGAMLTANAAGVTGNDIVVSTLGPPVQTRPLIRTPFNENGGMISPDGKWIAYNSDETGRPEIYVRPFPAVDQGRWQVSIEGGAEPRWARNGRELVFQTGGGGQQRLVWAAPIEAGQAFVAGKPIVVAKLSGESSGAYDMTPDGRFLFHLDQSSTSTTRSQMVLVQNWVEELKARVPIPR